MLLADYGMLNLVNDIFSCAFNYSGDTIITASKDNTCKIWSTKEVEDKKEDQKDFDDDED